jgi:hypothetical protein
MYNCQYLLPKKVLHLVGPTQYLPCLGSACLIWQLPSRVPAGAYACTAAPRASSRSCAVNNMCLPPCSAGCNRGLVSIGVGYSVVSPECPLLISLPWKRRPCEKHSVSELRPHPDSLRASIACRLRCALLDCHAAYLTMRAPCPPKASAASQCKRNSLISMAMHGMPCMSWALHASSAEALHGWSAPQGSQQWRRRLRKARRGGLHICMRPKVVHNSTYLGLHLCRAPTSCTGDTRPRPFNQRCAVHGLFQPASAYSWLVRCWTACSHTAHRSGRCSTSPRR